MKQELVIAEGAGVWASGAWLRVRRGQVTAGGGALPQAQFGGSSPKVRVKSTVRGPASGLQADLLRLRPWGPGGGGSSEGVPLGSRTRLPLTSVATPSA